MEYEQWASTAHIESLRNRARLIQRIRNFFIDRDYLEVETPIMAEYGVTDVYLENITAQFQSHNYALQTSPEFHMKRLLASGSGAIFQLSKAFRDDEIGRWHNPEFTMLEWYCPDISHHQLIDEVDALLQTILQCDPLLRVSYQQLFERYCEGINPHIVSLETLRRLIKQFGLCHALDDNEQDKDQYLFLLLADIIEPQLKNVPEPIAVYDFPLSQASLAASNNGVAQRFEIYYKGVELANGFLELCDASAQLKRFQKDNKIRCAKGQNAKTIDTRFIAALEYGLPSCSGVALGVDRLIALALGKSSIKEVMAFTINNA